MKRKLAYVCALPLILAVGAFAPACSSTDNSSGQDAVETAGPDASPAARDAGMSPPTDSGTTPADSGPAHDAAAPVDSGMRAPDAGMTPPPADSGTTTPPPADSGTGSSDVGPPPMDSGTQDMDTGTMADTGSAGMDAAAPMDAAQGALQFGAACDPANDQCDQSMMLSCHLFGQLGNVCTKPCAVNTDCPVGSMGQKCSGMGFCRP